MSVESRGLLLSRLAVPLVLVAVVAVGWKWLGPGGSDDELVKRGRRDFRLRRLESALELADRVIARSPGHRGALRLAGELSIERGDYDRSVAYLCELPDAEQPERLTGMLGPGDRMDSLRSLSRLAGQLEKRIGAEPRHAMANDHLAFILTISGRRWEARRPLLQLLRRGRFTKRHLVLLGEFENVLADPVMLEACLQQDSNEHLANLGLGLIDVERRDFSGALGRFESVAEARRVRKMLGGGMRQVGVLAAAGHVALDEILPRLPQDHANARDLAELLSDVPGLEVDLDLVESNIVFAKGAPHLGTASRFAEELERVGVRVVGFDDRGCIRAVTYHQVSTDDVQQAAQIIHDHALDSVV